jgi:LysM repeat protein
MEKNQEDRLEPEIEVIHDPEDYPSSSGYTRIPRPKSSKKWMLIPMILAGVVLLTVGLWVILSSGFISLQKPSETPEFKALQTEVQKLRAETAPVKQEIQTLQEGQKALQEQTTALKNQITVLAQKAENVMKKKPASKVISYKTHQGDTVGLVAKKFHVQPEEIRRWNRLPSKSRLQPSQRIIIYSPVP